MTISSRMMIVPQFLLRHFPNDMRWKFPVRPGMTSRIVKRNGGGKVRLVVLKWGHRARFPEKSASGGVVIGTPGTGGESASTWRVTKTPLNVASAVLEHVAGYENALKCSLSRAGGAPVTGRPGRVSGPRRAGPSRSTRRRGRDRRRSGRRRGGGPAGASICGARRHRRGRLCPCLTY